MAQPLSIFYPPDKPPIVSLMTVGVGGAGGNALNHVVREDFPDLNSVAINTDQDALNCNLAQLRLSIGQSLTNGRGTGSIPELARLAAEQDRDLLFDTIQDEDLLFILAGFGKGTGTGAAPFLANLARQNNILTIGLIFTPFDWEGDVRKRIAEEGLIELRKNVDALMVISNQSMLNDMAGITAKGALNKANEVLGRAIQGIYRVITDHGEMNLDFADVTTILRNSGETLIGLGCSDDSQHKGAMAVEKALKSPMIGDYPRNRASRVLVNITGSNDMKAFEMSEIMNAVKDWAGPQANVLQGIVFDDKVGEEIQVTLIAAGFDEASIPVIIQTSPPDSDLEPIQPAWSQPEVYYHQFMKIKEQELLEKLQQEQETSDQIQESDSAEDRITDNSGSSTPTDSNDSEIKKSDPGTNKPKGKYIGEIDFDKEPPEDFDLPIFMQHQ